MTCQKLLSLSLSLSLSHEIADSTSLRSWSRSFEAPVVCRCRYRFFLQEQASGAFVEQQDDPLLNAIMQMPQFRDFDGRGE